MSRKTETKRGRKRRGKTNGAKKNQTEERIKGNKTPTHKKAKRGE
jgi:hypothetical protein